MILKFRVCIKFSLGFWGFGVLGFWGRPTRPLNMHLRTPANKVVVGKTVAEITNGEPDLRDLTTYSNRQNAPITSVSHHEWRPVPSYVSKRRRQTPRLENDRRLVVVFTQFRVARGGERHDTRPRRRQGLGRLARALGRVAANRRVGAQTDAFALFERLDEVDCLAGHGRHSLISDVDRVCDRDARLVPRR